MRLIKKAICILVIFALAVSLVPTTASASALTVVGTSFSSAGMTSAEFAASAGPYAIGILAALAAAYGIKTFVQSDTGQAVREFFQELIESRAAATRRTVAEQMEWLLGDCTISEDGTITYGRRSFAEAKETLFTNQIAAERPTAVTSIILGDYRFGNSLNYLFYNQQEQPQIRKYAYYLENMSSSINNMFFVDSETLAATFVYPNDSSLIQGGSTTRLDYYLYDVQTQTFNHTNPPTYLGKFHIGNVEYYIQRFPASNLRCPGAPTNNASNLINQAFDLDDLRIDYAGNTLYGIDQTLRDQTVGLKEGLVLAPDLINSAVLGGAAGEITASDYCGALVDYVSGYDTVIDGVTVTGLPEAGTVPRSIDEAPTSDTVIDEAPPSTMTGTEAAGIYAFSLDELFPFCLPFDFVRIIEKFNVEPEAPNFDWRFYIPNVIDYTLHIDLSAWNNAAQVCRTMVLIAFMVGLIMLTRQIFLRA